MLGVNLLERADGVARQQQQSCSLRLPLPLLLLLLRWLLFQLTTASALTGESVSHRASMRGFTNYFSTLRLLLYKAAAIRTMLVWQVRFACFWLLRVLLHMLLQQQEQTIMRQS